MPSTVMPHGSVAGGRSRGGDDGARGGANVADREPMERGDAKDVGSRNRATTPRDGSKDPEG